MSKIRAVFFDVGETLLDETRLWTQVASASGLSTLTFFSALGAIIERRQDHRATWDLLGVERVGRYTGFDPEDLYPDALPCLRQLHEEGYLVGLAGNQPESAEASMRAIDAPIDVIASSGRWGVHKPSPEFFDRVCQAADLAADAIAYVGDRVDNDVLPAKSAGMFSVFIRRGPWGHIQASWPEASEADARIVSLSELPSLLERAS